VSGRPLPEVHEDIHRAHTLPGWIYGDPEVWALVRERVFARSWQLVADTARLRAPGSVLPITLLEGVLDEPLLLARDRDDRLHALSNVCTHRGSLVCESEGVQPYLRCRYHGRRFGLDGRLLGMPEFEGVEGFPAPSDDLPRVAHGVLPPFLFVSLDPDRPLKALTGPVTARCGWLPWESAVFDPSRARDYLVRAHWALYVENYLEGFHIPYVHAGLAEAIDYGAYATETFDSASLQLGVARDGEEAFAPPPGTPDHGRRVAAYWWWLFPNTMLNVYPWGVSVNIVRPLAPDRTKVSFLPYVWDATRLDLGAGAALDRVEREDEVIVESVQRGLRARLYDRGRYAPERERGVHHFHRMLAAALRGA